MKNLKKFSFILSPHERKRATILIAMGIITALIDMAGVASIMPFIAVLTNPDIVQINTILNTAFELTGIFGIETNQEFLFLLGIIVFIFLLFSITFKALTMYMQTRFIENIDYSICKKLVDGYLNQPYSWFLNRNSAELGKSILSEVRTVINRALKPFLDLISKSFVTFAILLLLILVNTKLALVVGFTLMFSYGCIYLFTQVFLKQIGLDRFKANTLRYNIVGEAFGAIKEIKMGGLEKIYTQRFAKPAQTMARNSASLTVVSQLPRFGLEVVTFGGLLLTILYLMGRSNTFVNVLPMVALYAFAAYRLMPALQQIYNSITQMRFVGPALESLYNDISSLNLICEDQNQGVIPLRKAITLKQVHYQYPKSSKTVLKNINLNIPAGNTVAFVGATGSGKTTTVDIMLGLLEVKQGSLEVDGTVITKNKCKAWQKSIGYVPQQIYLADDTISANIAFGENPEQIDQKTVERVAKIAELHNFVINDLPKQYQTTVGERGVRLSGGQRQRIGIARALYHNPQLLVMDEATNALDNLTEQAIMKTINNLKKEVTIILIAHRLDTIKECDNIFFLEKGELKAQGNFSELIEINDTFRIMAKKN